jgi:predicted metalloprotease with PDZ domain
MIRIIFAIITLSFVISAKADVNYQLYHQDNKIHVVADFGKQPKKLVKLYMPGVIWGTDYSKQIKNINVQNGNYNPKKSIITLKSLGQNLTIEYDLINTQDCKQTFTNKYYHFIDKDKFYLIGQGLFIYPENLSTEENINININIDSDVKQVIINNQDKAFATRVINNTKREDLYNTLIFGDKKFQRKNYSSGVDIIIWGDDSHSMNHLFDITNKIVKIQKKFWKDNDFKKTIIFIINPFIDLEHMWGGTNFGNLTLNFIDPKTVHDRDFKNFLAHENFHTWFGPNIGFINGFKYFTEGFTDYFAYLINMQNKIISKEDFIKKYNHVLSNYFTSPYYQASEDEIENMFWYGHAQQLPYRKGFIIANELDLKIRKMSKGQYSLKDIFVAMCKDARLAGSILTFSPELVLSYVKKVTGQDLSTELEIIFKPRIANLTNKILRKYALAYQDIEVIDYEFDYIQTMNAVPFRIKGLNQGAAPYQAGLRNGQKFTSISHNCNEGKCEIEIILDNKKVVKYIPKMKMIKVPFYEL